MTSQASSLPSKLDQDFACTMLEIEQLYEKFPKQEKIRIQQWSKKLCQVTTNPAWKRNRNVYAEILLEMIYSSNIEEPFSKIPPEGSLPVINRANFTFVHRRKETKWGAQRTSTPKRHCSSAQELPKSESVKQELQQPKSQRQLEALTPPKAQSFAIEPLTQSPLVKITAKSQATLDEIANLKAKLDISQRNEQYLREELLSRSRTISEQQKAIEQLKSELADLRKREENTKSTVKPQRYSTYIDNFERETAKIAEETLALQKGLKRGKSEFQGEKPQKKDAKPRLESLDEILGIEETIKGMKELELMQRRLKIDAETLSREGSLNYSSDEAAV